MDGAQINGAWRWRDMGPRSFSDVQLAADLRLSRVVAITALPGRDGDQGDPAKVALAEALRKSLRPSPVREIGR